MWLAKLKLSKISQCSHIYSVCDVTVNASLNRFGLVENVVKLFFQRCTYVRELFSYAESFVRRESCEFNRIRKLCVRITYSLLFKGVHNTNGNVVRINTVDVQ